MPKVKRIDAGQSGYAEYEIVWDNGTVTHHSLSPYQNEKALYAYKQHRLTSRFAADIKKRSEKPTEQLVMRLKYRLAEAMINRYLEASRKKDKDECDPMRPGQEADDKDEEGLGFQNPLRGAGMKAKPDPIWSKDPKKSFVKKLGGAAGTLAKDFVKNVV
jgi:hypothetical protein